MNCQEVLEQLPELQESTLNEESRAALTQHLDGCDACREQDRLLRGSWDMLDAWEADLTPSSGFVSRVMRECTTDHVVPLRPAATQQWRFVPPTVWSRVAAAAAVVALGLVLFLPHQKVGGGSELAIKTTTVPTIAATASSKEIAMDPELHDILSPAPASTDELLDDVLKNDKDS